MSSLHVVLARSLRHTALALLAVGGVFVGASVHAQNIVVNGSFEFGNFADRGDGYQILGTGSTAITGWTVFSDSLAWGTYPNAAVNTSPIVPQQGNFFLDLQGDGTFTAPYGGVMQTLSTTVGQLYQVSFYLGTQQDANSPYTHGPISVDASAGSFNSSFIFDPTATSGTQWGEFTFSFTATSTSTNLSFLGSSTAAGAYIGLDNVSVTAARNPPTNNVPDGGAGTLALVSLGLVGLAVIRRVGLGKCSA